MKTENAKIAIIGAGSIGIAVAYYLSRKYGVRDLVIIDSQDPMTLTSAQSGENYRNWWPHPFMTAFTNDSIRLMDEIVEETGNRIAMTRRGYSLVTRMRNPDDLIADLFTGYGEHADSLIRIHESSASNSYRPPVSADPWQAPDGVDVLLDQNLIRMTFPSYAKDVSAILHIRRAGSISGQQLGQFMLEYIRERGGRVLRGKVVAIEGTTPFEVATENANGGTIIRAEKIVNAAGPFLNDIAALLGESLPVSCVYQQKIAFEDRECAVPRNLPFTIDLDGQTLPWTDEEKAILEEHPATAKLLQPLPGGIHCRPDGAERGKWIKLGWATNTVATDPHREDPQDPQFPDIVLRAASRLQPSIATYVGRLPRGAHHYGGYYTMTDENWPLIGPMATPGAYIAGALSGFGTMAACISGSLTADWIFGKPNAAYATAFTTARYADKALMAELSALNSRGVL